VVFLEAGGLETDLALEAGGRAFLEARGGVGVMLLVGFLETGQDFEVGGRRHFDVALDGCGQARGIGDGGHGAGSIGQDFEIGRGHVLDGALDGGGQ